MKLKDYQKLKQAVEQKNRNHEQAEGVVAHLEQQLLKKFGCKNLAEAKKLYAKKQKKEAEAELAYEDTYAKFHKKWKHLIANETS